jgi:hypothetical protein
MLMKILVKDSTYLGRHVFSGLFYQIPLKGRMQNKTPVGREEEGKDNLRFMLCTGALIQFGGSMCLKLTFGLICVSRV